MPIARSNIKPTFYNGNPFWQIYRKEFKENKATALNLIL